MIIGGNSNIDGVFDISVLFLFGGDEGGVSMLGEGVLIVQRYSLNSYR